MAQDPGTIDARRFTTVGFLHPHLGADKQAIRKALGPKLGAVKERQIKLPGWRLYQAEYLRSSSMYPTHRVDVSSRTRQGGRIAHDIFIASTVHEHLGPATWIASPYIQLLDEIHGDVLRSITTPAVQYVGMNMPTFYASLAAGLAGVAAKRVILRIVAEPNVELVSLTGKMPLHSEIHDSLSKSTLPYGVGVQVEAEGQRCRVTTNRTGMTHWFQSAPETIVCPLTLLSRLDAAGVLRSERLYPLTLEARTADEAMSE